MKNKGFTLMELLAVITILLMIVLIVSISVSGLLKNTKNELTDAQEKAIFEASKSWITDNMDEIPSGSNCTFILLKDLEEDGLLNEDVRDLKNNKSITNELKIKIKSKTGRNGNSIIDYEIDPKEIDNCTYIGSNIYVDVPEGLTKVIYDEKLKSWRVPNINEEWYNYDKQQWANAVVLGKGKTKKPGEKVIVEGENPDALMMLVYIPRYEYKIEGDYGKGGIDAAQPGEIEVKFVNKRQTTPDNGYLFHPAFTFGEDELYGLWVGKFELSSTEIYDITTSNLRILPGISSLGCASVSDFFTTIRNIENTDFFGLSNIDTHMMKNSEWGAVAYLSQSNYGKYGNSDYEDADREIYINNSLSGYTGRSGGSFSGNTRANETYSNQASNSLYSDYGYYTYDGYLLNYNTNIKSSTRDIKKGTGASTTGNIYGIYDMSGGKEEYMMAVYKRNDIIYTGYDINRESGFKGKFGQGGENTTGKDLPNSKYIDIYSTYYDGFEQFMCGDEICKGHSLIETKNWYNDIGTIIREMYPWIIRGLSGDKAGSGIFAFSGVDGSGNYTAYSTRVIFVSK